MRKSLAGFMAIVFCVAMTAILAGCGSSSAGSSSAGSSSASTAVSSASASTGAAATATASASASASGALISVDGVDVTKVAVEMVGNTPNLQLTFANNTDKDVEFDLSKFRVLLDDKDEVNFHLTKTTVKANTPYLQRADTASADTLKVGDSVTVYYGDTLLGTFEVNEF